MAEMNSAWKPHLAFRVLFGLDLFFVGVSVANELELMFGGDELAPLIDTFYYEGQWDTGMIVLYATLLAGLGLSVLCDCGAIFRIRGLVFAAFPAAALLFASAGLDVFYQGTNVLEYGDHEFNNLRILGFAVMRAIYAPIYLLIALVALIEGSPATPPSPDP